MQSDGDCHFAGASTSAITVQITGISTVTSTAASVSAAVTATTAVAKTIGATGGASRETAASADNAVRYLFIFLHSILWIWLIFICGIKERLPFWCKTYVLRCTVKQSFSFWYGMDEFIERKLLNVDID